MKKNTFILITSILVCLQSIAMVNIKKETLFNKVSFLSLQEKDSIYQKQYLNIEKLYQQNQFPIALEQALTFINLNINQELRVKTFVLIGTIYRKNGKHVKSISFYKKALKTLSVSDLILEKSSNESLNNQYCGIYLKLGNIYLRTKQKDSAKYFYNKILKISSLDDRLLTYQASASANLSQIYMQDSIFDLAKEYAIKAATIHRKRNNKVSEAAAIGSLAGIYLSQNDFIRAKKTYKEALYLIKHDKSDRALRLRENLYFNLGWNLYKLKDYEAYNYQEKSYEIKDSLRKREIKRMIEEISYEFDFNSKKVLFQKKEENKRLKAQKFFWIAGVLALFIIFSLVYSLNLYKLKQKNLGLKLQRTELIKNKQFDKLKSESQVRILNATIDGKESERKEIAETLHDSVSSLLSSANLHLQATRKQFNGSTPLEINKAQEIITEASEKIRNLSHTLISSVLLKFGLNFAIREMADKFSNSELTIETDLENLRRYHPSFEIKVYNIVQEFANNILKHSKATKAKIIMKEENSILYLQIIDNGKGFDKTKIGDQNGIGINQIDARVQIMKGYFQINSEINGGTHVKIKLPIQEREVLTSLS